MGIADSTAFVPAASAERREDRPYKSCEEVVAMKTTVTKCATKVLMILLLASLSTLPTLPAHAADLLVEGARSFAPIGKLGAMASGAAEDTLKACMARIPEVGSVGQRLLAEQSCRGEEESRKAIQSSTKF
jgi:hypothetical protein